MANAEGMSRGVKGHNLLADAQEFARPVDRRGLEVAATDAAPDLVGRDDHLGAGGPGRVAAADLPAAGHRVGGGQQQAGQQTHQRDAEPPGGGAAPVVLHRLSNSPVRTRLG